VRISRDSAAVVGVLALVTAVYVLVVYRRQAATLTHLRARAAERQRKLADDAAKASRVPALTREVQAMRQRYNADWDRRLPEQKELAGFLREISANLVEENLQNHMIAPGEPTRGRLYNMLPITMRFEGDFLSLAGFLKRVDGMTRLTRIEQLRIEPTKDSSNLQIELGMNIYFTEQPTRGGTWSLGIDISPT
jgi:type IV pilus assembly protein PilO